MKLRNKFVLHAVIASVMLALAYLTIVSFAQSFSHAVEEFLGVWYLMVPLMAGFGTQVGFFSYVHNRIKTARASAVTSTSGTISTVSMIACCAHHLTDILPVIGLGAVSLFLSEYYVFFMWFGIMSNLIGISLMLGMMQKSGIYPKNGYLRRIFSYDMKKLRNFLVVASVVILPIVLVSINPVSATDSVENPKPLVLSTLTNDEAGLTFSVRPIDFDFQKEVSFEVIMDTHVGSLDFDPTEISYLEDDSGRVYTPTGWAGSSEGGHHREGVLSFPRLSPEASYMRLTIENVYGVPARVFLWRF